MELSDRGIRLRPKSFSQWWILNVPIHCSTNCSRFSLKKMWRLMKTMAEMKRERWAKDEIEVAVQIQIVNNITMPETCANLTIEARELRQRWCCGVFIVKFEQISHIILVFPCWLWTSKYRLECYNHIVSGDEKILH